jgi:NCAIR mutase (PurE)-related protein
VHRLLASSDELSEADVVVVVAGMEGALASLVAGLTPAPVVAVPTSVGYGAALEGVTALLAMLASCAAGLTVVGIDNGFGAASAVMRLLGSVDGGHKRGTAATEDCRVDEGAASEAGGGCRA